MTVNDALRRLARDLSDQIKRGRAQGQHDEAAVRRRDHVLRILSLRTQRELEEQDKARRYYDGQRRGRRGDQ